MGVWASILAWTLLSSACCGFCSPWPEERSLGLPTAWIIIRWKPSGGARSGLQLKRHIRLVAVDLDYTLLNSDFQISQRNTDAIAKAVAAAPSSLWRPADVRLDTAVCPGAGHRGTPDNLQRKHMSGRPVPTRRCTTFQSTKSMQPPIRLAASLDVHCSVYVDDVLYVPRTAGSLRYTAQCAVEEYTGRTSRNCCLSSASLPPRCCRLRGARLRVFRRFEEVVSGRAHVTRSSSHYVELVNKGVSKASALEHLCRLLGVLPEETMAIGDGYNDIEMISMRA